MKKHITILSAVALSLALSAGNLAFAAGKTSASSTGMTSVPRGAEESPYADRDSSRTGRNVSYLDAIRFENRELVKDNRTVSLNMDIVLDSTRIKTQHTVSLTPVIVSEDGKTEQAFETIIIDGRTRHKVFLRKDRLDGSNPQRDSAQAIIQRKNGKDQEYIYVSGLPYGRWMLDGSIRIDECVKGCVDCGEGESEKNLMDPVLPEFIPQWTTGTIEPDPEPIKRREESRVARLQFKWDKYDILPELADNRAVLDTVTSSIDVVKEKDYIAITGIYVAGFASPEGTYEYNIRLSSNRAKSFADYIEKNNEFDHSLMHVEWSGEDWEGFRSELEKSTFAKKDQVIDIIDTYTRDRNECEREMMNVLTDDEYTWLLRNIYPYLRHCTYRVEYEVRNFDLEEARRTIYERPQDLSLNEMYKVAGSYEKGSEEYAYAMEMAARYYPETPAVVNRLAVEAMESGDTRKAVEYAGGMADRLIGQETLTAKEAELLNTAGVAYARAGEYGKARTALEKASGAGNANAEHNLTQLLNVIDQL